MDAITIDDLRSAFGPQVEKLVANTSSTENALNSIKEVLGAVVKSVEDTKALVLSKLKKDSDEAYAQRDEQKAFKGLITNIKSNTQQLEIQNQLEKNRDKQQKSFLSKIFGPIALVLTTVAALGFGLTRFPALRQFISNTTGNVMGNILNVARGLLGKEALTKEWLKNIPFIGYLVHIYDAFSFFAKGKYAEGIKELAFNIPGIDFIAPLFGTTRQRLMDKSSRTGPKPQGVFSFNIEETLDAGIEKVDSFLKPVGDFFNNALTFAKDLYFAVTKGDYASINKSLNSLAVLFPVLGSAASFMSSFVFKQFQITESNQGPTGKSFFELNFFDVAKDLYSRVSESIGNLFNDIMTPIMNVMKSLGLVFSGDLQKQKAGFAMLDVYFPGLSGGLKLILGAIDRINEIRATSGGKLPLWKLLTTSIDTSQYDVALPPRLSADLSNTKEKIKMVEEKMQERDRLKREVESLTDTYNKLEEQKKQAYLDRQDNAGPLEALRDFSRYKQIEVDQLEVGRKLEAVKKQFEESAKTQQQDQEALSKLNNELQILNTEATRRLLYDENLAKIYKDSGIEVRDAIREEGANLVVNLGNKFERGFENLGKSVSPKTELPEETLTRAINEFKDKTLQQTLDYLNSPLGEFENQGERIKLLEEYLKQTLDKQLELSRQQNELQVSTNTFLRDKAASPNIVYTQYNPTNNVLASNTAPIRAQRMSYISGDITNG